MASRCSRFKLLAAFRRDLASFFQSLTCRPNWRLFALNLASCDLSPAAALSGGPTSTTGAATGAPL
eukprot:2448924-Alexandrium_andersonii.AAC.1